MICVVSHDAGGAEIISSYVRQKGLDCQFVLDGPAIKIFQRKLKIIKAISLNNAINTADWFLCGTSWQSDIEWQTIRLAKLAGKKTVAFLDHWVNYEERFVRGGEKHLPDEIWVGDELAENKARGIFPEITIRQVNNPYFIDLKQELSLLAQPYQLSNDKLKILYVCEPIREHALLEYGNERHSGYTEEEALRYFLENLSVLGSPIESIVLRPHPSEAQGKYAWAAKEFKLPILNGGVLSLFEEVSRSDVVVGCESMAMVVGLLARRRVICCIPPGGKPCALPQPEIESMQKLLMSKISNAF